MPATQGNRGSFIETGGRVPIVRPFQMFRMRGAAKDQYHLQFREQDWENALSSIEPKAQEVAGYKGKLSSSKETLLEALKKYSDLWQIAEIVENYASLQHNADEGDQNATNKEGRAQMAVVKASSLLSFFDSEITAIDDATLNSWIETPEFADYKIYIKKLLHLKQFILYIFLNKLCHSAIYSNLLILLGKELLATNRYFCQFFYVLKNQTGLLRLV